jgi:hypothetical protein
MGKDKELCAGSEPRDFPPKLVHVNLEKIPAGPPLRHEVSAPPYSIFSPGMKAWIVFLVSVSALISPFGAATYFPALNVLSEVLHISPAMTNVSITTYMVSSLTSSLYPFTV